MDASPKARPTFAEVLLKLDLIYVKYVKRQPQPAALPTTLPTWMQVSRGGRGGARGAQGKGELPQGGASAAAVVVPVVGTILDESE